MVWGVESVAGYLGPALIFVWGGALQGGFNCFFSGLFCYYWQGFHFGTGTGCWDIVLWDLDTFLIFSNFLRS